MKVREGRYEGAVFLILILILWNRTEIQTQDVHTQAAPASHIHTEALCQTHTDLINIHSSFLGWAPATVS
uniref:Uncharacterized protein n=1 Tax=Anguilla anguilla TaxID=7936 RepID=A0A0E9SCH0_ANGAN